MAIAEYERAIELNPNFSLAYGCLGDALSEIGDSDEAIKNINFAWHTPAAGRPLFEE